MPRPCSVCRSSSRARVETALAEGASFASVSRESRFSELSTDALERHWARHVAPEVRDAVWGEAVSSLSLAARMASLATEATRIRSTAVAAGDGRLALQAIKVESDLLARLTERLGIEASASEDDFAEAEALARVVAQIARQSPRAGNWIADQLPADRVELAEAIRGVAHRAELRNSVGEA